MQQEKEIPSVKTSAVARAVKEIGQFMLMDIDEGCFLVTERFILQLKRRDAWRIQCKLGGERRKIYYNKVKSNWIPSDKKPDCRGILENYISIVGQSMAETAEVLSPTGLAVVLYRGMPMDGRLYAGMDSGFTLVQGDYLDMLGECTSLIRVGDFVIANGFYALSLLWDAAWAENPYIKQMKQIEQIE